MRVPDQVLRTMGLANQRAFKALKRRQVKEARRYLRQEVIRGCAWSPAHTEIHRALELLDRAAEKQSAKNWGR